MAGLFAVEASELERLALECLDLERLASGAASQPLLNSKQPFAAAGP
jgi:hypothetical protein